MIRRRSTTVLLCLLLASLFAGSTAMLRTIDSVRGKEATLEEVLYLPSGKTIKRMSLGYSNLLADVYWTRAVQYFGSKHIKHSMQYDLLYPLLDITTDLDPSLIVAYEYGSVFLSQPPPEGAGQPDKAVTLVEKGIRQNPEYWRLYFTLGFIHYMDRHDPKAAQEAFEKGSEIPGALGWMKVMAARMAERSKDVSTSLALWQAVYETTYDKEVKHSAHLHIVSLQADIAINELQRHVQTFHEKTGTWPVSWMDLIRTGFLPGVPLDPYGNPYQLKPDGTVDVKDSSGFPYLGEWRYNQERPF